MSLLGLAPPPLPDAVTTPLVDRFSRAHTDLRVSLTDRCDLRCDYCMPATGLPWIASDCLLSAAEIIRVARIGVGLGITKVRLTGGEPLLRIDCADIIAGLAALRPRPQIALTTNGVFLGKMARQLRAAGLDRVNISLDALDEAVYTSITRRNKLPQVLAGLAEAKKHFETIKLNAVLLRGVNEDQAIPLLRFAIEQGFQLRFIEQMPLGPRSAWQRDGFVSATEILEILSAEFDLEPLHGRGAQPAELWQVRGTEASVGIIASVTRPFCADCSRLRLTADGQLRSCLFATEETDLRQLLRHDGTDAQIAALLADVVLGKAAGHGIDEPGFQPPGRGMSQIGG
jgi:cyclic pyranopterin phosphate synthase